MQIAWNLSIALYLLQFFPEISHGLMIVYRVASSLKPCRCSVPAAVSTMIHHLRSQAVRVVQANMLL